MAQQEAEIVPARSQSVMWRWLVVAKERLSVAAQEHAKVACNAPKMPAPHLAGDRQAVALQAADAEVVGLASALHGADMSGRTGACRRRVARAACIAA